MTRAFSVTGALVTHDEAPLAALEAANRDDPEARLRALAARESVAEAFLLQTCNRVEEYVVAETADAGAAALADVETGFVRRVGHEESLQHLLRVAAGLESQVLGEDQILGQVRTAYTEAQAAGTVGPVLEAALLKAIHVGERARTETAINDGTVSLGSAAVQLAARERELAGRAVLLIGAGQMATDVARGLAAADVGELRLVNRSPDRASDVAEAVDVPVRTAGLAALTDHLRAVDTAITTTASPEPVIGPDQAAALEGTLVVDLAQPRDVDPAVAERSTVELHDLDALTAITAATHEERRAAAEAVERIVEEEYALLIDQYKRRRADAVIRGMYQGAEAIKGRELETALSKLEAGDGPSEEQRAVVEQLADALVAQLLAVPTKSLREAAAEDDWETVTSAIRLFDPSLLEGDVPPELRELAAQQAAADAGDD